MILSSRVISSFTCVIDDSLFASTPTQYWYHSGYSDVLIITGMDRHHLSPPLRQVALAGYSHTAPKMPCSMNGNSVGWDVGR